MTNPDNDRSPVSRSIWRGMWIVWTVSIVAWAILAAVIWMLGMSILVGVARA